MAQTRKSIQDYEILSFGEELQIPTTVATEKNGRIVGGIYLLTPPTLTDGMFARLGLDSSSNLKTTLATALAGEDITNDVLKVEQRFSYANILTATTTTVKSGAGFLHVITFNKPVASEVWTIYDNTAGSGTIIGTITLPATLLNQGPMTAVYDVSFSVGLTIVSGSTTDGTVSYR